MWQKNNGQSESEILQNQFTAYLTTAVQRRRKEYIIQALRRQQIETLIEKPESKLEYDIVEEIFEELPLLMRLENEVLLYALKELNERERNVFLERVLDDKGFEEMAVKMNISYKGVAAIYYRALQKIRKKMMEVKDEF